MKFNHHESRVPNLTKIDDVCATARRQLNPAAKGRWLVERTAEKIRKAVDDECKRAKLQADVRVEGSVAKDTWIPEYVDIDIFMLVSPQLTKDDLGKICLPVARQALRGNRIVERFAEHPYVEAFISNGKELRVNVVPCYDVKRGNWLSATDRTPFHTQYIRQHLNPARRGDVRLLKAFLRSIGTYGADIKTGGFSGMLVETLVLDNDGFSNVLRNFAEWNTNRYSDVERYYENRSGEIRKIFPEPLVVIDPVDKGRNLGAAVRADQLWNFVAASRHFLMKPTTKFFTEPAIPPLPKGEYERLTKSRGSDLLCVSFGRIDGVVDVLWSQLFRTQRALTRFLEQNDFEIIKSAAWSNEEKINIIIFELESNQIPGSKKHLGPPVNRTQESASFLTKHRRNSKTVSGPWIENQRWVVQKRREHKKAEQLLKIALKQGSRVGMGSLFIHAGRQGKVLNAKTIAPIIVSNSEFSKFIRNFLEGRPVWYA
jgi:tRNA nucleotidyltransferase (CCA-adding enzyme)